MAAAAAHYSTTAVPCVQVCFIILALKIWVLKSG